MGSQLNPPRRFVYKDGIRLKNWRTRMEDAEFKISIIGNCRINSMIFSFSKMKATMIIVAFTKIFFTIYKLKIE